MLLINKLNELKIGDKARIQSVHFGGQNILKLMSLGLLELTEVEVISKTSSSIELKFENNRIALSLDSAKYYSCVKIN